MVGVTAAVVPDKAELEFLVFRVPRRNRVKPVPMNQIDQVVKSVHSINPPIPRLNRGELRLKNSCVKSMSATTSHAVTRV